MNRSDRIVFPVSTQQKKLAVKRRWRSFVYLLWSSHFNLNIDSFGFWYPLSVPSVWNFLRLIPPVCSPNQAMPQKVTRENGIIEKLFMHQGQLHSFLRTQCLTITIFNDDAACPVKTWKVNDTAFYQPLTPYLNQIEAWITCLKMIRASPCKVLSTRRKRMSSMAAKQKWLTCQPTALYVSHTTWLTIPRSEEHRIIWEHRMFWKGLYSCMEHPRKLAESHRWCIVPLGDSCQTEWHHSGEYPAPDI